MGNIIEHVISKRQEKLLDFVVREYIRTAKPIGSVLVAGKSHLHLSPATIRNEMFDLEQAGYLSQFHTSGGRVPTDKTYRYFVNSLLEGEANLDLGVEYKTKIKLALGGTPSDPREVNKIVARVLSNLSENLVITGVSTEFLGGLKHRQETTPRQDNDFFKKGLASLFEHPEFRETNKVFQLANFFEEFEEMFKFIEREFFNTLGMPRGVPIQILIGGENPFKQIKHETIMCAKYGLPGDCIGSLTLVGPTRMDYEKNISLIKYITEELNKLY